MDSVGRIVDAVRDSERPLTKAELEKVAGKRGFKHALAEALRTGDVHEHPKIGKAGVKFWREPWQPDGRILEVCDKAPATMVDLAKKVPVAKPRLEETVRKLEAEGKLKRTHKFAGGNVKPGTRFATREAGRAVLNQAIAALKAYYGEEAPDDQATVDDEATLKDHLQALETRADVPVAIEKLRRRSGLNKQSFDRAVIELYRKGAVALYRHDAPFLISEEQRNELVTDGEDRYYVGISWTEPR